jgi:hypothetical protein
MDKLEKYINDNRDAFDDEPLEGHFQRFDEKLKQLNQTQKRPVPSFLFLKIASVLVIVLLSANLIFSLLRKTPEKEMESLASKEMNDAVHFYSVKISSGMNQLNNLAGQGIGSEKEVSQLKKEMEEMDLLFQSLQNEYSANPNDERIINAMIEHYQTKLNIINRIKSDLENIKQIKNKNHENINL